MPSVFQPSDQKVTKLSRQVKQAGRKENETTSNNLPTTCGAGMISPPEGSHAGRDQRAPSAPRSVGAPDGGDAAHGEILPRQPQAVINFCDTGNRSGEHDRARLLIGRPHHA